MQIHRYPLTVSDRQVLRMPTGSKILSVVVQNRRDRVVLYALVDDPRQDATTTDRVIRMYPTDVEVPNDPGVFLGTIQLNDGYVFQHVFEGAA